MHKAFGPKGALTVPVAFPLPRGVCVVGRGHLFEHMELFRPTVITWPEFWVGGAPKPQYSPAICSYVLVPDCGSANTHLHLGDPLNGTGGQELEIVPSIRWLFLLFLKSLECMIIEMRVNKMAKN